MDIRKISSQYDPTRRPRTWSRTYTMIAAVVLTFAVLGVVAWSLKRHQESGELEAKLRILNEQVSSLSTTVSETQQARQKMESFIRAATHATQKEDRETWAPALQSIAASVEEGIQLAAVGAAGDSTPERGWRLRIEGVATGLAPRLLADRYRWKLQEGLTRNYRVLDACRFERLEYAAPGNASAGERTATFTISASIATSTGAPPTKGATP